MILKISFLLLLPKVLCNFTFFDLTKCKLTHAGTEYLGKIAKTETNETCQYWAAVSQKVINLDYIYIYFSHYNS